MQHSSGLHVHTCTLSFYVQLYIQLSPTLWVPTMYMLKYNNHVQQGASNASPVVYLRMYMQWNPALRIPLKSGHL